MISFREFLLEEEQQEGKALKHLRHLEDNVLYDGHEGVARAANFLDDANNHLQGKKTGTHFSTKYDGAPSIVYGTHPQTGRFFVATKSAFNKEPKINYTPEDIERNHGHAPGLVEKLKAALVHLPKVMPKGGGVYQGDMMYTKPDVQTKAGQSSFTPNTITYSSPTDSPEGAKIKNSQMGFVTHTKYSGKGDLQNLSAGPLTDKDRAKFSEHPDVNHIDPTAEPNPNNYTPEEQHKFSQAREEARKIYASMKPEAFDALQGHGMAMETHVNDMVRKGGNASTEGYIAHLKSRHSKALADLDAKASAPITRGSANRLEKLQAKRQQLSQDHADLIDHITKNKKHFDTAFKLHGALQRAKDVLTGVMAKNVPYGHSIGGEATNPEGAVAVNKSGDATKFVDRAEFSRQNFLVGKIQQAKKAKQDA